MTLDLVVRQVRLAMRSLGRRPVLTGVALVTLALGIGANTAIFSIINVVLLKPLPFRDPERLLMVWSTASSQDLVEGFSSYPDFRDWQDESRSFDGLAAFWTFPNGDVNLSGGSEPQRVSVARITPEFFDVLGVRPLHGRTFQQEETVVGNHRRAILSHGLWHNHFAADPTVVGRSVMVNQVPYTVVGIMPADLAARSLRVLGTDVQIWRPLVPEDNQTGGRDSRRLRVVGRLAVGVTIEQARGELSSVARRLAVTYPESNRETGVHLVPLREQVVRDVRLALAFLSAAVGIVLLGACANIANLLLIKAAGTRKQIAVQHALGASRLRLASHVLTESLLLGIAGAVLGIGLAYWSIRAFVAMGPADIPLLSDARIDGTVLAFTVVATLATVVLVGLVPAWRASRPDAVMVLRQGGTQSRGRDDRRLMRILGVWQIALAMGLLTTGGLLLRSFQALLRVDPGLDRSHVLTFQLELPMAAAATYPTQPARDAFFSTLLERVTALPGVRAATFASAPPLEDDPTAYPFSIPGTADDRLLRAHLRLVTPEYFSLLGIPILQGRSFMPTDNRSGPPVAIVSAALARSAWGTGSPVGERIATPTGQHAEIIGVAGDVRTGGLDAEPARIVYAPALQVGYNFMTVLVKSHGEPTALVPSIRALVKELDPALPLHRVQTVDAMVARSVVQQRFQMLLVGAFSLMMMTLAVVGIYGITAYGVSARTSELGIRAALGATAQDIRWLVMLEGGRIALLGIVIGGVAAAALSRALTRFVFQISTLDPITFVTVPLVLAGATLLATVVPAHRAARTDPVRALRTD